MELCIAAASLTSILCVWYKEPIVLGVHVNQRVVVNLVIPRISETPPLEVAGLFFKWRALAVNFPAWLTAVLFILFWISFSLDIP